MREISRLLAMSRNTVRRILREPAGDAGGEPQPCDEATLVRLKAAFARARGNAVRVRELLADEGLEVPYSTLTRWVRDADLRGPPRRRFARPAATPICAARRDAPAPTTSRPARRCGTTPRRTA